MQHSEFAELHSHRVRFANLATILSTFLLVGTTAAAGTTLDRVKESGKLTLGYEVDARPFSFADTSGKASGYSVALCERVAEEVKKQLAIPTLQVEWVPVKLDERLRTMQEKKVDLLCGADTVTLARRAEVGFSIPIFSSGIGALLRADAPLSLRFILAHGRPPSRPIWRGYPARTVLGERTFAIVRGTRSEKWLQERLTAFQLSAKIVTVDSYEAGLRSVLDRGSDVFFGDLPILLDEAKRSFSSSDLVVIDRQFTFEPIALALERDDDDFRLTVDRALSTFFPTQQFRDLYTGWFGKTGPTIEAFFHQNTLPP